MPFDEVTFAGAGVNHMAWVLRFERDGETSTPCSTRRSQPTPTASAATCGSALPRSATSPPSRASTSPSTCRGSCATTPRSSACGSRSTSTSRRSEENIEPLRRGTTQAGGRRAVRDRAQPRVRVAHHPLDGHRHASGAIYGNVRNRGLIGNLPAGRVRRGALPDRRPRRAPDRGGRPAAAMRRARPDVPERAELTVRAALEGRRDHVLQAVLLDPNAAATLSVADDREAGRRDAGSAPRRAAGGAQVTGCA